MNAIVSVTQNWAIGLKGSLLVRNVDDMRYFKEKTMGGAVVCGRTTFESFPGGALKGRRNIVLSRDTAYSAPHAEVVHSVSDVLTAVADHDADKVWLIGGGHVYRELLPYCDRAFVTKHETLVPADAFFPNLDEADTWSLEDASETFATKTGVPYRFLVYLNAKPQSSPA